MNDDIVCTDTLRSRLQEGIAWNVAGAVATSIGNFLVNIIIANILGQEKYGAFGIIQSTLLTISGIAQMATGFTATKYIAEYRSVDKAKTGRILGLCSSISLAMSIAATVFLMAFAGPIARNVLNSPQLGSGLLIAAGFVLFSIINGYQSGALAGLESYRSIARLGIIHSLVNLVVCGISTYLWGLEGTLFGFVGSAFARWYLFHAALKAESASMGIPITYTNIFREKSIIYRFALPAAVSGWSSMPSLWLANAFLVRQINGLSQMGLYSAANVFRSMVLFLPILFNNVSMSILNHQMGLKDSSNFRKVFLTNILLTAICSLGGTVFIVVFGRYFLGFFGNSFMEGHDILLVLMISTIPESLALALTQIAQSKEKMWHSFYIIALPRDISFVVFSYLLAPMKGAVGVAWAYTLSRFLSLIASSIVLYMVGLEVEARCSDLSAEQ
jgi:O-antigen/teichoic acid export membrane protein